jgi:hypothetical protein
MYYKKKGYSKKNTKGHSWLFKVVLVVFGMVDVELNITSKNAHALHREKQKLERCTVSSTMTILLPCDIVKEGDGIFSIHDECD